MGYRPRPPRSAERPAGACFPGQQHQPEPVTLLDGTTVGHICRHCLVQLRPIRPPGGSLKHAMWRPYSDAGVPLSTLPNPVIPTRY